jgi:hypothetical protein
MNSFRRQIGIAACAITLAGFAQRVVYSCEENESQNAGPISIVEIGEVEAIKDAEFRLGGTDRIFLIEDEWDVNRCGQLLPKLPKVDLTKECLLVVMSWKHTARTLKSVDRERDTLVVSLDEEKPPLVRADSYHPPKFLVVKLPAWKGPVRVEINGEPRFTILRGSKLVKRTDEIWEEILRIHSGGRPTTTQIIRNTKRTWPDVSDEEIKRDILLNKDKYYRIDPAAYYDLLFRDLVDIRAKPAIPRIFALIESMGKHDKASQPATEALIGIGGPEVIEQCKIAMKSWNPRARATAMGLLAAFATPDMRGMAREKIAELDRSTALNALEILRRIGITKDDVPSLIRALEKVEEYYTASPKDRPKLAEGYDGEMGTRLIYSLGELGPDAAEAIPILERFTTDPRLPLLAFQKNAQEAIDKTKQRDSDTQP